MDLILRDSEDKGSDDWMEFFDRAAACRGELPKDIPDDAEVVKNLPVF